MKIRSILLLLLSATIMFTSGCSMFGPRISYSPAKPLIAADLEPYRDARAVLLAVKEPPSDPGIGVYFGSLLFNELLKAAPFGQVAYQPDVTWFSLQSAPHDEQSSAAAAAADLGFDLAVMVAVERFIYSRNAPSTFVVSLRLVDSTTGELVHAQRLEARGEVGYMPPVWDPNLNQVVDREDLIAATANTLVARMNVHWHDQESEESALDDEDEDW